MSKREAAHARRGGPRARLGRSAHADARRPAPPRLHAGVDPRLLRAHRRRRRPPTSWSWRTSSTACARTSTSAPSGAWPCCDPLKLVIENYPEGQVEEFEAVNNPEDPSAGTRKVPFSRDPLHRAGRLPGPAPAQVLPPLAGHRGAPALRVHHQVHGRGARRGGQRDARCAAPTIPPRAAATRPAARSRARSTGCRRRTPSTPRCGSTTRCSRCRSRTTPRTSRRC